jgi:hypothetical protein
MAYCGVQGNFRSPRRQLVVKRQLKQFYGMGVSKETAPTPLPLHFLN